MLSRSTFGKVGGCHPDQGWYLHPAASRPHVVTLRFWKLSTSEAETSEVGHHWLLVSPAPTAKYSAPCFQFGFLHPGHPVGISLPACSKPCQGAREAGSRRLAWWLLSVAVHTSWDIPSCPSQRGPTSAVHVQTTGLYGCPCTCRGIPFSKENSFL